jgi:hypothetical protein
VNIKITTTGSNGIAVGARNFFHAPIGSNMIKLRYPKVVLSAFRKCKMSSPIYIPDKTIGKCKVCEIDFAYGVEDLINMALTALEDVRSG